MRISMKMFVTVVLIVAALLYFRHESNDTQIKQRFLKTVIEKPIGQIERELNPTFVRMVTDDNTTKEKE